VNLLAKALEERFQIHPKTVWVNYVRVHDDIGWTFSDEDAATLSINAGDHRRFLNEFYRGEFSGSFARGLPFQEDPETGDCRISGTCASLAGLEKALTEEGPKEVDLAIRRILLIHGIIMTVGGIPLIYLGDEIGTLNDYGYHNDPMQKDDSRWVHRVKADWERYDQRNDPASIEGRVFQGLRNLIRLRKKNNSFSNGDLHMIQTKNDHVLGFTRAGSIIFANFSEVPQLVSYRTIENMVGENHVRIHGASQFAYEKDLTIEPLDFLVIAHQVRG
jgi:hypothetical protein